MVLDLLITRLQLTDFDILLALKMRRFWVQTTVAGITRLTLSRPTDNALPASTILSESRPASDAPSSSTRSLCQLPKWTGL
jgi:hypothetical protein